MNLEEFYAQIGGDYADVSLVLLPGMESHMYDRHREI